jgi:hypothetical protein
MNPKTPLFAQEGNVSIDVAELVPAARNNTAGDDPGPLAPAEAPAATTKEEEDDAIMKALFAAAVQEPPESESRWQVLGFESRVVEECYDATHGATRVGGCWVMCAVWVLTLIVRISSKAMGTSLTTDFAEWLAGTCGVGLVALLLLVTLCRIRGGEMAKRHTLRQVAFLFGLVAYGMGLTTLVRRVQGSVHFDPSMPPSWDTTFRSGYFVAAISMGSPLGLALLLRVRFPWAASASVLACTIPIVSISSSSVSEDSVASTVAVMSISCSTICIAMMYATEASLRWRFTSQIHIARLQAALDINCKTLSDRATHI